MSRRRCGIVVVVHDAGRGGMMSAAIHRGTDGRAGALGSRHGGAVSAVLTARRRAELGSGGEGWWHRGREGGGNRRIGVGQVAGTRTGGAANLELS